MTDRRHSYIHSSISSSINTMMDTISHTVLYRYQDANGVHDLMVPAVYFQQARTVSELILSIGGTDADIYEAYAIRPSDLNVVPAADNLIVEFYADNGVLDVNKVISVHGVVIWQLEKVGDNSLIYVLYTQRKEFAPWTSSSNS